MKIMIGAIGWATILGLFVGLSGCDDTKKTCEAMCAKVKECLPAQLDAATKSLPEGAGDVAEKMKEEIKKKLEEAGASVEVK